MVKRLVFYVVIVTWIFAMLDWVPIHRSWQQYGYFPDPSVNQWWGRWTSFRTTLAKIVCPPCGALAENWYFSFFEVEAGLRERGDLLTNHAPYSGNPLLPDGPRFWWGQGGAGNSNPWKPVSMIAWYMYWLPPTLIWWVIVGDFFYRRRPWWLPRRVK